MSQLFEGGGQIERRGEEEMATEVGEREGFYTEAGEFFSSGKEGK